MINCAFGKATDSKRKRKHSIEELASNEEERIALTIIQNIPVGIFRSTDCKEIVDFYFPQHSLSKTDSAKFGAQFLKTIWPLLENYGVGKPHPDKRPHKYEMNETTKKKINQ